MKTLLVIASALLVIKTNKIIELLISIEIAPSVIDTIV